MVSMIAGVTMIAHLKGAQEAQVKLGPVIIPNVILIVVISTRARELLDYVIVLEIPCMILVNVPTIVSGKKIGH